MRRAMIAAISLLLITLAGYAQASDEKMKRWAQKRYAEALEAERQKPMSAICQDILEGGTSEQEKAAKRLCARVPAMRLLSKEPGCENLYGTYEKLIEMMGKSNALMANTAIPLSQRRLLRTLMISGASDIEKQAGVCTVRYFARLIAEQLKKQKR